METLSDSLAAWAAALKLEDIPRPAIDAAKRCIIDVVGVGLAGCRAPVSQTAKKIAFQEYPPGPCLVFGSEPKLSPRGAAFCNGVFSHCLDFDDTCYDGIVHGSAAVWPAVLAAGEAAGACGEEVLTAFVAGVEIEYFLGRFFTHHLYMKGWWNSAVLGVIGAAAAAAKVQGFDETAMRYTIRNAVCYAFGTRAVLGTQLKPMAMGDVPAAGIYASITARNGLAGPADVFESPRGFTQIFNDGVSNEAALEGLGRQYSLVDPGVAFKLYPVCSAAQAGAEVLGQILNTHDLSCGDVAEVVCQVPTLVGVCLVYDDPASVTQSQFSMPFALGCILAYGRLGVEHLNQETLRDPKRVRESLKVKMVEKGDFKAPGYDAAIHPEAALVTVTTTSGRTCQMFNGAATGMPVNPMADDQLDGKFLSCARTLLPPGGAAALLKSLRSIEEVRHIGQLLRDCGCQ